MLTIQFPGHTTDLRGSTLPTAEGKPLQPFESRALMPHVVEGARLWAYSPCTLTWEPATVVNTNLLEERFLFEVACDRRVRSDLTFHRGRGISCHIAYHGVDWVLSDPDRGSSPPEHPRTQFPKIQSEAPISFKGADGKRSWGIIEAINSVTQTFTINCHTAWPPPREGMRIRRELPFGTTFTPLRGCGKFHEGDIFVDSSSKGETAFAVRAYDPVGKRVVAEAVSMLASSQCVAFSLQELASERFRFVPISKMDDILKKFPALERDGDYKVEFNDNGRRRLGETAFYKTGATLPAYLEVLIRKTERELEREAAASGGERQLDVFHRFNVAPDDIIAVYPRRGLR